MPITVTCSNSACAQSFAAPDAAAGQQGNCPSCGAVIMIPAAAGGLTPASGGLTPTSQQPAQQQPAQQQPAPQQGFAQQQAPAPDPFGAGAQQGGFGQPAGNSLGGAPASNFGSAPAGDPLSGPLSGGAGGDPLSSSGGLSAGHKPKKNRRPEIPQSALMGVAGVVIFILLIVLFIPGDSNPQPVNPQTGTDPNTATAGTESPNAPPTGPSVPPTAPGSSPLAPGTIYDPISGAQISPASAVDLPSVPVDPGSPPALNTGSGAPALGTGTGSQPPALNPISSSQPPALKPASGSQPPPLGSDKPDPEAKP